VEDKGNPTTSIHPAAGLSRFALPVVARCQLLMRFDEMEYFTVFLAQE